MDPRFNQWDAHFMLGMLDCEKHKCQDARTQLEWCARKFPLRSQKSVWL